jgi:hypothetical protein
MINLKRWTAGAMASCLFLSMAGCQTYGEGAGAGAAVGALAGGIIGNQSGNALAGAAIGAAAGALVGVVAHDIKVQRAKDRAATVETYKYQPSQGEVISLEEYFVTPNAARAGTMITSSLQYALITGTAGTPVTETRRLLRGGQVIADLSSKKFTREDGTWLTTQDVKLPDNLQPGRYTLVQKVETPTQFISGNADFTVQ